MPTLADQLAEAKAALHSLRLGKAIARFRDANGEEVQYSQANRQDLAAYVADLENQIAGIGRPTCSGPMRVIF